MGDVVIDAQSPQLLQRAHDLVNAPHLFGMEIGFNLPAFCIALVITAILVVGIKESAAFNSLIVVIKVSVVLFVILLFYEVPLLLNFLLFGRSRQMA